MTKRFQVTEASFQGYNGDLQDATCAVVSVHIEFSVNKDYCCAQSEE